MSILKTEIRNSVAQLLFRTGITAPARRGCWRLSIVTFHRVLPDAERQAYPFPSLVVTPEELDSFLTYFAEHFDCGTLATQHMRYMRGEITSRPLLAITFDDAQHDNYFNARPVLARHQIKASFFVPVVAVERQELLWHDRLGFSIISLLKQANGGHEKLMQILASAGLFASSSLGLIERVVEASKRLPLQTRLSLVEKLVDASATTQTPEFARIMTFSEILELASEGHEIGSHSMTHCLMTECDDQTLIYELAESRSMLQTCLGRSVETFCYPNGNSNNRTARAVAVAGYSRAVTTSWGYNEQNGDRFQLCRFNMDAEHVNDSNGKLMPAAVAFRMSGFYPGLR